RITGARWMRKTSKSQPLSERQDMAMVSTVILRFTNNDENDNSDNDQFYYRSDAYGNRDGRF
ncbi:unnamed protein product, partial [Arabidopsis lyrata]